MIKNENFEKSEISLKRLRFEDMLVIYISKDTFLTLQKDHQVCFISRESGVGLPSRANDLLKMELVETTIGPESPMLSRRIIDKYICERLYHG